MQFLNSWLEVVTTVHMDGHANEICASAVAHYDRTRQEAVVYRDAFARHSGNFGPEEYFYPDWLPDAGVVRSACSADKAEKMAEQHFAEWAQHVQSRLPGIGRAAMVRSHVDEEVWHCTGSD